MSRFILLNDTAVNVDTIQRIEPSRFIDHKNRALAQVVFTSGRVLRIDGMTVNDVLRLIPNDSR